MSRPFDASTMLSDLRLRDLNCLVAGSQGQQQAQSYDNGAFHRRKGKKKKTKPNAKRAAIVIATL